MAPRQLFDSNALISHSAITTSFVLNLKIHYNEKIIELVHEL